MQNGEKCSGQEPDFGYYPCWGTLTFRTGRVAHPSPKITVKPGNIRKVVFRRQKVKSTTTLRATSLRFFMSKYPPKDALGKKSYVPESSCFSFFFYFLFIRALLRSRLLACLFVFIYLHCFRPFSYTYTLIEIIYANCKIKTHLNNNMQVLH